MTEIIEGVAPFTGAWIEIRSHRGKFQNAQVAPFTGAWIEIAYGYQYQLAIYRRALHGRVD